MDHAITVGAMLSALAVLIGLGVLGFCGLMLLASMMSDASPCDGPLPAANWLIPLGACALVAGGIWGLS